MNYEITETGEIGTLVKETETHVKLHLQSEEMAPPLFKWFEKLHVKEIVAAVAEKILPGSGKFVDAAGTVIKAVAKGKRKKAATKESVKLAATKIPAKKAGAKK